jgi:hypothetical protein
MNHKIKVSIFLCSERLPKLLSLVWRSSYMYFPAVRTEEMAESLAGMMKMRVVMMPMSTVWSCNTAGMMHVREVEMMLMLVVPMGASRGCDTLGPAN